MAGAPSFGKMSTFICWMAIRDVSAIAMTATTIVIGRRRAVSTSHMVVSPADSRSGRMIEKQREIAPGLGDGQQRTPDAEVRDGIVGFGLREEPLRIRHFGDVGESALIASPDLILSLAGRLPFDGCVLCDFCGAREQRSGLDLLRCQSLDGAVVPRGLGNGVLIDGTAPGLDREDVECGKSDRRPDGPVRHVRP